MIASPASGTQRAVHERELYARGQVASNVLARCRQRDPVPAHDGGRDCCGGWVATAAQRLEGHHAKAEERVVQVDEEGGAEPVNEWFVRVRRTSELRVGVEEMG